MQHKSAEHLTFNVHH